MDRTALPAIGLAIIAAMYALVAATSLADGSSMDVGFMGAQAVGFVVAAWGVRDFLAFPGEASAACGLTFAAVVGTTHFFVYLVQGAASMWTIAWSLVLLGTAVAAAAAWHWHFALGAEEQQRMMGPRAGIALFGIGILGFLVLAILNGSDAFGFVSYILGLGGAALFVVSLDGVVHSATVSPASSSLSTTPA